MGNTEYLRLLEILKDRRKQLGLNQTELGLKIGVSQQQVAKYERNIIPLTLELATKWANALGLKIEFTIK